MSEVQKPIEDTPAPTSASADPTTAETTVGDKTAPAGETPAVASAGSNTVNPVKEEKLGKNEKLITSKAINEGVLNYKGTGLKGLIFSKKYFWLSEAPLEHNHLSTYLSNEKSNEIAHPNVAQATQSGKGLLYYAKRAEDKDHPQGILNIADMTDLQEGDFNDFSVKIHGKNHTFQALNKNERDGWLVALNQQTVDAQSHRETLVATPGYKSALEKYSKPTTLGAAGKTRSLSRPGKSSKSRERVKDTTKDVSIVGAGTAAPAAVDSTATHNDAPATDLAADPTTATTGKVADTPADTAAASNHHVGEAAAGAAVGAAVLPDKEKKIEKEEKKEVKKEEKAEKKAGRSQSRGNKRSSIFGGLLGKKDENDEKKAIKREEKEEKKEIKAEEKAEKKEEKNEEKAEKKEEKALEKELKHEGAGTAGGFDAAAVASRVMGEPVMGSEDMIKDAPTTAAEPTPAVTSDGAADAALTSKTPKMPTSGTNSKANKRNSVFSGLFSKKDTPKSTTAETSPLVPPKDLPAKDEPSTVASTAPQLDNPVTSPTAEATPSAPVEATAGTTDPTMEKAAESTAATTASPAAASATTPTDKRRTSFFSSLGTKKEKRAGTTSGDELTDGEGKKTSGVGGLFRKASRAASKPVGSGTTGASATKTTGPGATAAQTADKTAETKTAEPADVPLPKTEPTGEVLSNGTGAATSGEKAALAPEEAGIAAMTSPEKATPVEATA